MGGKVYVRIRICYHIPTVSLNRGSQTFLAGVSRIWTGELICKPTGTIEKGGGEDIRKNSRALVEAAGPRFFLGGRARNLLINYRHRSKSPVFSFVNAAKKKNCRPAKPRGMPRGGKQYSNYNINKYKAPDLMGLGVCRVTMNQRQ